VRTNNKPTPACDGHEDGRTDRNAMAVSRSALAVMLRRDKLANVAVDIHFTSVHQVAAPDCC